MPAKLTYEKVKHFVEVESMSGCELISEFYTGSQTPLEVKCRCGDSFKTTYQQFKHYNKRQCNSCGREKSAKRRRNSYSHVKNFIELDSKSGCILLSDKYTNNNTSLKIKCKCGRVYKTTFNRFKSDSHQQCTVCSGHKFDYQHVKEIIEVESKNGCKLISDKYEGGQEKIVLKCKCRNIFETTLAEFIHNGKKQCNECGIEKRASLRRKSNDEFLNEVHNLVGYEYTFLEEYIGSDVAIKCIHSQCKHEFAMRPSDFLNGQRCPRCGAESSILSRTKTDEEFQRDVYNLVGDEYTFLEKYINVKTNILCRHNVCGHEWYTKPNNFLRGKECPQCLISKGERSIMKYLENKNIRFIQEYSFDGLTGVGGMPLRFDFAIFDSNENLLLLIEYDGEFHFNKYYEDQNFETMQIHDERKNQYCKNNNIPLLRIPYWEFDKVEEIVFAKINSIKDVM